MKLKVVMKKEIKVETSDTAKEIAIYWKSVRTLCKFFPNYYLIVLYLFVRKYRESQTHSCPKEKYFPN
jgi:hypothetical protein